MSEEVTKFYKKALDQYIKKKINEGEKNITAQMNIGDRVQRLCKKQAFLTIKDCKENFPNNPSFHLINPTKNRIG